MNYEEAKLKFLRAVELDSQNSCIYIHLGLILWHLKDEKEALDVFEKALLALSIDSQKKEVVLKDYSAELSRAQIEEANSVTQGNKEHWAIKAEGLKRFLSLFNAL